MSNWFIASEENLEYLAHYGVKGMKWRHKIGRAFRNVFGDNGTTTESYHRYGTFANDRQKITEPDTKTKFGPKDKNGNYRLYVKDGQTTKGKYGHFSGEDSKEKYRDAREEAVIKKQEQKSAARKEKLGEIKKKVKSKAHKVGMTAGYLAVGAVGNAYDKVTGLVKKKKKK